MRLLPFLAATLTSLAATAHEPAAGDYSASFSKFGEGKLTRYAGRPVYHHVRPDDLPSEVSLFEEILPPKSLGAPPHTHSNEDEIFVVLDGRVHFLDNESEIVAEPGTIASLPRHNLHGFWNPYDQQARILVFTAPGHFDQFFEAVEQAVNETGAATPEAIGAIIAEEAAKKGVIVDMSKLPPSAAALLQPPE